MHANTVVVDCLRKKKHEFHAAGTKAHMTLLSMKRALCCNIINESQNCRLFWHMNNWFRPKRERNDYGRVWVFKASGFG